MAKSKYHNTPTAGYASKKEHNRACTLRLLQRAGIIADLQEQVPYLLIPAKRRDDGTLERKCEYIADFVYTDLATGKTIVEDSKGVRTDVYKIKRKLMLERYDITIKET